MKRTIVHMAFIVAIVASLSSLSACPPTDQILSELIIGTWDNGVFGAPAQFNSDGTYVIGMDNGTYEILGNAVLLTRDGEPGPLNALLLLGMNDGKPVVAGYLPVSEWTPVVP